MIVFFLIMGVFAAALIWVGTRDHPSDSMPVDPGKLAAVGVFLLGNYILDSLNGNT